MSAILAVLLLAGWVHVASPPAAAGPRCEVSATGVEVGCSTGGSGSGGSGGGTGGATRVCTTAFGRVVACTTALGTWTGDCYARPANPQPPFTDPVWGGRTDGTVLVCTVAGNGTYFAQRYYWVPDATVPDPAALAREAVAGLALAPPPLAMTPPPNLAEPNILINRPAFFTFSDASTTTMGPITATAADGSLRVSVTARLATITIDTGDGTTIACSPAQVSASPGRAAPSSACSYTWSRASGDEPDGTFHLTATSHWEITWTGGGQRGAMSRTSTSVMRAAITDYPVNIVYGE